MDIPPALMLQNTPIETLQADWPEAESAFREIEERLGCYGSSQDGTFSHQPLPIATSPHTITIGLTESKLVIDVLSEAYDEAKRSGYPNVEVKLSNAKFIESVQLLWSYIAEGPSDGSRGIKNQLPENNRPRKCLKITGLSQSKHVIPTDFMDNVSNWIDEPLSFFEEDEARLGLEEEPLAEAYKYLIKLEKRADLDIVRGRLLKVLFHYLRERLGVQRLRSDRVQKIAQIIFRSGLVKDYDNKTITKWLDKGNRIDGLCQEIGSIQGTTYSHLRNLFYLNNVVDTRIIRLKLDGKSRTEEIQEIKTNLIYNPNEALKLEKLASSLMNKLWEAMEGSIPELHSLQESQQIPIFQVQEDYSLVHDTQTSTSFSNTSQHVFEETDTQIALIQGSAQIASYSIFNGEDIPSGTHHTEFGNRPIPGGNKNGNIMDTSGAFERPLDPLGVPDTDWEGNVATGVSDTGLIPPLSYSGATLSPSAAYWSASTVMNVSPP